jgi:hypothetical protein
MSDMKEIPGLTNYFTNVFGQIWTRRKDGQKFRLKKQRVKNGRQVVQIIHEDGSNKQYDVAELVLLAFHGPAPDGCKPIYRDSDTRNCFLSNLSWGQRQRRSKDAVDADMAYDLEYLGDRGINKCLQLYWVGGVDKIAIANDLEIEFRTVQHILDTHERVYGDKIYT